MFTISRHDGNWNVIVAVAPNTAQLHVPTQLQF